MCRRAVVPVTQPPVYAAGDRKKPTHDSGGVEALARGRPCHLAGCPRRIEKEPGVVDDAPVAGPKLDGGNRSILLQTARDDEAAVDILAVGREGEGLGHFEDEIGLAQLPAIGELRSRRQVFGIAFFGTGVGPTGDGLDLLGGQPPLVLEVAVTVHGFPRRHAPGRGDVLEEVGALGRVLVAHQGEGANLAGPMAAGAVLEQNRCHLLAERDRFGARRARSREDNSGWREQDQERTSK